MNKIKQLLLTTPVLVLLLGLGAAPVYAKDGVSNPENKSGTPTTSETSHSETPKTTETHNTTNRELEQKAAVEKTKQAREEAAKEIELSKDKNKDKKTTEEIQKKCEDRKHGLGTKVENINISAQKHYDRITDAYTKALQYQKDHKITVENFGDLTAKADATQAQAQASIDALKALKPPLDCTKASVVSDVQAYKAAVAQAKADLKAYRSSVKNVLQALETAKEGTN